MYNRYVPSEHSYTAVTTSQSSQTESEVYPDKEKYIREDRTAQGARTNSNHFFRDFGSAESEKWKNLGKLLGGTKFTGLKSLFSMFQLDDIDTGDILLFFILLFLLSEGDDLDLIITLGLMLLLGFGEEKKRPEEDPSGR